MNIPPLLIHTAFDITAALASLVTTLIILRWRLAKTGQLVEKSGGGYFVAFIVGAVIGGFGLGSLNLYLSDVNGIGRSILGAFVGAVIAVEWYKKRNGIVGTTGIIFVPAFAISVTIGRLGCFFTGLEDQTYGTQANISWAVDLGDNILRHPVQLYESVSMAAFFLFALIMLQLRNTFFMANGFYLLAIWYGTQRFAWEFLKPYAKVAGPLNLFHFACAALIFYGCWMILKQPLRGPQIGRKQV